MYAWYQNKGKERSPNYNFEIGLGMLHPTSQEIEEIAYLLENDTTTNVSDEMCQFEEINNPGIFGFYRDGSKLAMTLGETGERIHRSDIY